MRIILASSSPRRKRLFEILGMNYEVIPPRVKEDYDEYEGFGELVESLALKKAREVFERTFEDRIVIGADTIVVYKGEILGKPSTIEEAKDFLRKLSGDWHEVYTGVAVVWNEGEHAFHEKTKVWFRNLPEELITRYAESGIPLDKAGAYGIQDLGAVFVERIEGDFYTVVGLPVGKVWEFFMKMGWWR